MKINNEMKITLYRQMLRIRLCEEKIVELYAEQEIRCPVHLSVGQEAPAVGVCNLLSDNDYVMSTHRAHAHYLAKGGDFKAMMAEFYGQETGCCHGIGGSMHLIDLSVGFLGSVPIVGSTIPIGVGVALGSVMQKKQCVVAIFFGDAAVEQGVFHESINFAVLKNLPVVFVCENNFYSVYSPLSVRQPKGREIFKLAEGYGINSIQGDGNNVLEVYEIAETAITKARHGKGPTFLEFKTYRWRGHCGPKYDNDLGYRTQEEFETWKARCPIARLRKMLIDEKAMDATKLQALEDEIKREIDEVVIFAKESPFPTMDRLVKNIYREESKIDDEETEVFPSN